jgi:uncharacterized protein (DUF1499 family)
LKKEYSALLSDYDKKSKVEVHVEKKHRLNRIDILSQIISFVIQVEFKIDHDLDNP